jgi:hypothetical protein
MDGSVAKGFSNWQDGFAYLAGAFLLFSALCPFVQQPGQHPVRTFPSNPGQNRWFKFG